MNVKNSKKLIIVMFMALLSVLLSSQASGVTASLKLGDLSGSSTPTVIVGQEFDLRIMIDIDEGANGYGVYLSYDGDYLEVLDQEPGGDIQPFLQGTFWEDGNVLENEAYDAIEYPNLQLDYSEWDGDPEGPGESGQGLVATITFIALAETQEPTIVTFDFDTVEPYTRETKISLAAGGTITPTVTDAQITIAGPGQPFEIPLKTGLNLIALPKELVPLETSFTLIPKIENCKVISKWDKNLQLWKDAILIPELGIIGDEFPIIKGEGYFILVSADTTFSGEGTPITSSVPLNFKTGLNLIGIPYPSNPPIPPGYTGYTSFTLIPDIPDCVAASMWDKNLQLWKGAINIGGGLIIGEDFPIVNIEGYFIQVDMDYEGWIPTP